MLSLLSWKFVTCAIVIIGGSLIAQGMAKDHIIQNHNHNFSIRLNSSSFRVNGQILISNLGVPCQSECARAKGTCDIGVYRTGYCSNRTGEDYLGRSCREDHPCGFHGKDYLWCYVDEKDNYGACGLLLDQLDPQNQTHLSYYGYTCKSPCVRRSSAGAECYVFTVIVHEETQTQITDEFHPCSMDHGTTDTGVACRSGSTCDFRGYRYQWCWVGQEGTNEWGYCGQVLNNSTDVAITYYTRYGDKCQSMCFDSGIGYFWCWEDAEDSSDWNYCSRKQDETVRGQPCMKYASCGKHGYNYYWCYLEDKSWDYCSIPVNRKVDKSGFKIRSSHQNNLVTENIHKPFDVRNESKIRRQNWAGKSYSSKILRQSY